MSYKTKDYFYISKEFNDFFEKFYSNSEKIILFLQYITGI